MSPIVGALIVFVAIAVIIGAVYMISAAAATSRLRDRLHQIERGEARTSAPAGRPKREKAEAREDMLPTVTHLISGLHLTEKLLNEMASAGMHLRPSEFIAGASGAILALMIIALLATRQPAAAAFAAIAGPVLVWFVLKSKQKRRILLFNHQLEPTLMLMASSLRSGYSFLRSMQVVSDEMPPPISDEFRRVVEECNVGVSHANALKHLLDRIPSYDLDLVVTAVMIQLQTGGNLAEILETIAETIRERVRIAGEMSVLTAEGRISGIILMLMPFGLGLALGIINPGYIRPLITERTGQMLMVLAVFMQIMGGIVIKRMLSIEI